MSDTLIITKLSKLKRQLEQDATMFPDLPEFLRKFKGSKRLENLINPDAGIREVLLHDETYKNDSYALVEFEDFSAVELDITRDFIIRDMWTWHCNTMNTFRGWIKDRRQTLKQKLEYYTREKQRLDRQYEILSSE